MLKVSLLTIGDEILIGQVINSNAAWIAEKCTKLGCKVILHSVIGDEKETMISELDRLLYSSDVLLITGGLGPTHDDITKPVLCEFFNDELQRDEETLKYVEKFLNEKGIDVTERNRRQADIPKKAKPIHNENGTAPGLIFDFNSKIIAAMPGVPSEMKYIMENGVLQHLESVLKQRKEDVVLYKVLHTIGIPESKLADRLGDVDDFLNGGSLAFLPSYKGVRLRLGIGGDNLNEAKQKLDIIERVIYEKAGQYIFGEEDDSISSAVGKLLKKRGETCSVAESCTGGLLGGEFTSVPGSSEYFTGGAIVYSNKAKMNILHVKEDTLEKHGAVSKETALELAAGVRTLYGTDYGIGITGIAGPGGGTEEKPVGTVWISIADKNGAEAKKYVFSTDRAVNRERSVGTALALLYKKLKF